MIKYCLRKEVLGRLELRASCFCLIMKGEGIEVSAAEEKKI